ncbi:MAG TPA: MFS transporter, partial [Azospirillaceae bacterium]|nr:MFS transporter [Azospirillaceae bacterium]
MAAPLPRRVLLAYGLPALPLAALTLPVFIFLPARYAELGLGLGTIGWALLLGRLWDGATDPLVGWLSDRTPGPWGRRRPWIAAGTPLTLLAVWFLLVPPADAGLAHLLGWSFALYFGWTMVTVPLTAWGAELTGDYDERSRVSGWLNGFLVAGTVTALVLPVAFGAGGVGQEAGALSVVAAFVLAALPPAVALLLAVVPEPPAAPAPRTGLKGGARLVLGNAPFRRLVLAYLLNGLANGLPAQLFLFYAAHVLQAGERAGLFLIVYFVSGIAAVPLWLRLSGRHDKHRVWCWAMLWACLWFAAVPLLGPGDGGLFLAVCVLTGLSLGADLVLPPSMQADAVDAETARTGAARTGLYFALWGLATKLAVALAAVGLPLASLAGFRAEGPNGPEALTALALLYGPLPVAFKLAA